MATLREIRRRIASIENIAQVTDAMRVVAAARLRRAQGKYPCYSAVCRKVQYNSRASDRPDRKSLPSIARIA